MRLILAWLMWCMIVSGSLAHDAMHLSDWIMEHGLVDPATKEWCCGENDCHVTTAVLILREGYWLFDSNELVTFDRAIQNHHDGNYWRCDKYLNSIPKVRCLIVPPPST